MARPAESGGRAGAEALARHLLLRSSEPAEFLDDALPHYRDITRWVAREGKVGSGPLSEILRSKKVNSHVGRKKEPASQCLFPLLKRVNTMVAG